MAFPVVSDSLTPQSWGTNVTQHLVTMPSTVDAGDLLIVFFTNDGGDAVTLPSGWTRIGSENGVSVEGNCFVKVAVGDEDSTTVDFVTSGVEQAVAKVFRVTGWFGALAGVEGTRNGGASATGTLDPPSHTASWGSDDNLWLIAGMRDDDDGITAGPTNYTTNFETAISTTGNGTCEQATSYRTNAAVTEDPGTFTQNNTNEEQIAFTVVVRPPAGAAAYSITGALGVVASVVASALVWGHVLVGALAVTVSPAASVMEYSRHYAVTGAQTNIVSPVASDMTYAFLLTDGVEFTDQSTDRVVFVPDSALAGMTSGTWLMWLKTTAVWNASETYCRLGTSGGALADLEAASTAGQFLWRRRRVTTNTVIQNSSPTFSVAKWYFLAVTFDTGGVAGDQQMYWGDEETAIAEVSYGTQQLGSGAVSGNVNNSYWGNTDPAAVNASLDDGAVAFEAWYPGVILSSAQIEAERLDPSPVRVSGCEYFVTVHSNGKAIDHLTGGEGTQTGTVQVNGPYNVTFPNPPIFGALAIDVTVAASAMVYTGGDEIVGDVTVNVAPAASAMVEGRTITGAQTAVVTPAATVMEYARNYAFVGATVVDIAPVATVLDFTLNAAFVGTVEVVVSPVGALLYTPVLGWEYWTSAQGGGAADLPAAKPMTKQGQGAADRALPVPWQGHGAGATPRVGSGATSRQGQGDADLT
jgi:hypothetical protein